MSGSAARLGGIALLAGGSLVAGCGKDEPGTGGASSFGKPAPTVAKSYEGLPVEAWTARLSDPDPAARFEATVAVAALDAAKDEGKVLLVGLLADRSATVRFGALDALGRIAEPDPPVVLSALALLEDADDGVRRHAKTVATRWGVASIPALRARLASKDDHVRRDVLSVLAALGADAAPAVPELSALLAGEDLAAQDDAAQGLAAMGAAGVPALMKALLDPRADTAVLAAAALERLGSVAAPAVPDLAAGLRRGGAVRRASLEALVAVGDAARAALEAASKDADEAVRDAAKDGLERLPKR